jgi:hypothetical protein
MLLTQESFPKWREYKDNVNIIEYLEFDVLVFLKKNFSLEYLTGFGNLSGLIQHCGIYFMHVPYSDFFSNSLTPLTPHQNNS